MARDRVTRPALECVKRALNVSPGLIDGMFVRIPSRVRTRGSKAEVSIGTSRPYPHLDICNRILIRSVVLPVSSRMNFVPLLRTNSNVLFACLIDTGIFDLGVPRSKRSSTLRKPCSFLEIDMSEEGGGRRNESSSTQTRLIRLCFVLICRTEDPEKVGDVLAFFTTPSQSTWQTKLHHEKDAYKHEKTRPKL